MLNTKMLIRLVIVAVFGGAGAAVFIRFFFPEMAADNGPGAAISIGVLCGVAVALFDSKSPPKPHDSS